VLGACAERGVPVASFSKNNNIPLGTTDYHEILKDPNIDAVIIATRHDKHAQIASDALLAQKHIYLEKPLALTTEELNSLNNIVTQVDKRPVFMVGYNRRYAPITAELKGKVQNRVSPLIINYRVNAGMLSPDHWLNSNEGGGRLIGEACHMIDFFQAVIDRSLVGISITSIRVPKNIGHRPDENFSAQLTYKDGSIGNLIYTSLGHAAVPKESIELFWDGNTAVISDFQSLTINGRQIRAFTNKPDKGHFDAIRIFFDAIEKGSPSPVSWDQLQETSLATLQLDQEIWGRLST